MTADPVVHGVTDEPLERYPAHERGGFPANSVDVDQDDHEAFAGHGGGIGRGFPWLRPTTIVVDTDNNRCYLRLMSKSRKARIEAESFARYIEANWFKMLGGNIAIAFKLKAVHDKGGHWIYTPATNCAGL